MKKFILTILVAMSTLMISTTASANMKCFKEPGNYEQGKDIGGFDKESSVKQGYEDVQDPLMDLTGCVLQLAFEGPGGVLKICGCKEAVQELCKFDTKKFKVGAKGGASIAMCAPFAPWAF